MVHMQYLFIYNVSDICNLIGAGCQERLDLVSSNMDLLTSNVESKPWNDCCTLWKIHENSLELHGMFAWCEMVFFSSDIQPHWYFKCSMLPDCVSPGLTWTMRLQARQSMQLKEDVAALQCADVKAGHEAAAHGSLSCKQIYLDTWHWEMLLV